MIRQHLRFYYHDRMFIFLSVPSCAYNHISGLEYSHVFDCGTCLARVSLLNRFSLPDYVHQHFFKRQRLAYQELEEPARHVHLALLKYPESRV